MRFMRLALIAALVVAGCAHRVSVNNYPLAVDQDEISQIKLLVKTYRANGATDAQRNDLQQRLMTVSDEHYYALRKSLSQGRNAINFVADVSGTTLSAVSALVGVPDTKSILSTASTLTQSSKANLDKDVFLQQSTGAVVSEMDALRAAQHKIIIGHLGDSIHDYGLEQALNDALAYDQAGTIQSALIAIEANAATQKNTHESKLQEVR